MIEASKSLWTKAVKALMGRSQSVAPSENPQSNKIQVDFDWSTEPQDWGGLSKEELVELVSDAADFFGMPEKDRSNVKVLFGDNHTFEYSDGKRSTYPARHNPAYSLDGEFLFTNIVINRSMEVLLHSFEEPLDFLETRDVPEDYDYRIEQGIIHCTLRSPKEAIAWFIAEEINHAHVDTKLGNLSARYRVKQRFSQYCNQLLDDGFYKNNVLHDRSTNIHEVTASRQVLRFLAQLFKTTNGDRAAFFNDIYSRSIQERLGVMPRTALILEDLYIWTGFVPGKDDMLGRRPNS